MGDIQEVTINFGKGGLKIVKIGLVNLSSTLSNRHILSPPPKIGSKMFVVPTPAVNGHPLYW